MSSESFQQRLASRLIDLRERHLHRARRTIRSISSTECLIDSRVCVNFAANDYLGLSHHPLVTKAMADVAAKQAGAGASALVSGRSPWHQQLEDDLAAFEQSQAAVLFPCGYTANFGMLTSLITDRDAVFCDRNNHASIVDGCRASAGRMLVYDGRDLERLLNGLQKRRSEYEQIFVVTDSVFSMDGTVAPVARLAELTRSCNAVLIVDEAHGTGVFGATGRGICELQGVHDAGDDRVIRMGTLSKAIGTLGGFVTGSQSLCDWLWNSARSQFFSTALPPAVCAAASVSLQLIDHEPARRERLLQLCQYAREELHRLKLKSVPDSQGPIVPVILGSELKAVEVSQRLQNAGFLIPAIRPPTVAPGTARLRISLCCDHTEAQIGEALWLISQNATDSE